MKELFRFIFRCIEYVVLMNLMLAVLTAVFGGDFEPNFIFNVVTPILCASASWEVEKAKAKKFDKK